MADLLAQLSQDASQGIQFVENNALPIGVGGALLVGAAVGADEIAAAGAGAVAAGEGVIAAAPGVAASLSTLVAPIGASLGGIAAGVGGAISANAGTLALLGIGTAAVGYGANAITPLAQTILDPNAAAQNALANAYTAQSNDYGALNTLAQTSPAVAKAVTTSATQPGASTSNWTQYIPVLVIVGGILAYVYLSRGGKK